MSDSHQDDLSSLWAAARKLAAVRYPGLAVVQVDLHLDNGGVFSAPVPMFTHELPAAIRRLQWGEPAYTDLSPSRESTEVLDAPEPRDQGSPLLHSADYRSAKIKPDGQLYLFTPSQSVVVRELHEAWVNGTPEVGQAFLLEKADSVGSRLVYLFRDGAGGMHPCWGTLIVPGKRSGSYRLALPDPGATSQAS